MTTEHVMAMILFAISSSVTPGPNNILVMTSGVNFGTRKSLPLLSGICVGFTVMLLLVGVGFGQIFSVYPVLHVVIKYLGVLYLLYLAWLIAKSSGLSVNQESSKPLTFMKGALFQWINGKAWVVATSAVAVFTSVSGDYLTQNALLALTFLILSFPCVGIWLLFGAFLKRFLSTPQNMKMFNFIMAFLLVLSVVPIILEIIKTY